MPEVARLQIKVEGEGVAATTAQMKALDKSTDDAGDTARASQADWQGLNKNIMDLGIQSKRGAMATDSLQVSINGLNGAIDGLMTRQGGFGRGGGPYIGYATDLGAAFRRVTDWAGAALGALLLITPTLSLIEASIVLVGEALASLVVYAAGAAAAIVGVGAVMAIAAYRWRSLLSSGTAGAESFRSAILAVEAQGMNMVQRLIEGGGEAGSIWDTLSQAIVGGLQRAQPWLDKAEAAVRGFFDQMAGNLATTSGFLTWIRQWTAEWQKLWDIINGGVAGGGLGFFEKFRPVAFAIAEGIARIVREARQLTALGLGLNIEELTRLMKNLFTFLSRMIGIFPRLSNALAQVALAFVDFLNDMLPVIEASFKMGEFILKYLVAPIAGALFKAISSILNLPLVGWLASVAGGLAIVAYAMNKLLFGMLLKNLGSLTAAFQFLLETIKLVIAFGFEALIVQFPKLASAFFTIINLVTQLGALLGAGVGLAGFLTGLAVAVGVVIGLYALWTWTSNNAAEAAAKLRIAVKDIGEEFAAANINVQEANKAMREAFLVAHPALAAGAPVQPGADVAQVEAERQRRITEFIREQWATMGGDIVKNATKAVESVGYLTDAQATMLSAMRGGAGSAQHFRNFLMQLNADYKTGVITTMQYVTILDQLGVKFDENGDKINTFDLLVQGVTDTIVQSFSKMEDFVGRGVDVFDQLGSAMGQGPRELGRAAVEAFNDVQGGITGTGDEITKFVTETAQSIQDWRDEFADSINVVKSSFGELLTAENVTFKSISEGLQDSLTDLENFGNVMNRLAREGASQALLEAAAAAGPAAVEGLQAIAREGPKAVNAIDKALRQGADLSSVIAMDVSQMLNITMQSLLSAVEIMVAEMTDLTLPQVRAAVADAVTGINEETGKIKPIQLKMDPFSRSQRAAAASYVESITPDVAPKGEGVSSKFEELGRQAVAGYAAGVTGSKAGSEATRAMAQQSVKAAAGALGTGSPSRVFDQMGRDVMRGFINGIQSLMPTLTGWMQGIGGKLIAAMGTSADTLFAGGESVMRGFMFGMQSYWTSTIAPWLAGREQAIKDLKGPHDRTMLEPAGDLIMLGLKNGMAKGFDRHVAPALRGMTGAMASGGGGHAVSSSSPTFGAGKQMGPLAIKGTVSFDWRRGIADLEGALVQSNRTRGH